MLLLSGAVLELNHPSGASWIEFEKSASATLKGDANGINASVPLSCVDFRLKSASDDPAETSVAALIKAIKNGLNSTSSREVGATGAGGGSVGTDTTIEGMLAELLAANSFSVVLAHW